MGLPTARVNARSGRVCMFVCANVHAPFLSKAPYVLLIPALSGLSDTHTRTSKIRLTVSQYSVAGSEPHTVLVAETDTLGEAC